MEKEHSIMKTIIWQQSDVVVDREIESDKI